jgi:type I restriction enzyme, S subunit
MGSDAKEGVLPPGWVRIRLGELGEVHCGQSPSVSEVNTDGKGIAYVTGPEQWNGHRIERNKWTEHPRRIAPEGSIFITVKGAGIGKLFPGIHAAIGRDIYAFTPSEGIDPDYVFYALRHTIDEVVMNGQGDIPGLSKSHILNHFIGLPGANEQRRIVAKIEELFSELHNGVESLRTARAQLEIYRQALLQHAFAGKLTADWRGDHDGELETPDQIVSRLNRTAEQRYQQSLRDWEADVAEWGDLGEPGRKPSKPRKPKPIKLLDVWETNAELPVLPRGWAWVRLGDISDVTGGLTKNPRRTRLERRMKYLRVANVYADEILIEEIHEIGVTHAESRKVALRAGDILVVEGNGSMSQIGRVAIWEGQLAECGHQNHLIRVRLGEGGRPRFTLLFLLSPTGRDLIIREASSTSGLHTLSLTKVSSLVVPIASAAEEAEVIARLDAKLSLVDNTLSEIDAQLARSELLRQAVLRRALAGKLVDQDQHEEPASVLLERIRPPRAHPDRTRRSEQQQEE